MPRTRLVPLLCIALFARDAWSFRDQTFNVEAGKGASDSGKAAGPARSGGVERGVGGSAIAERGVGGHADLACVIYD